MPEMHVEKRIPKLERFTFWILIQFFGYTVKIIFVTYVKMMPEMGTNYFMKIVMSTKVTVTMLRWQRQCM